MRKIKLFFAFTLLCLFSLQISAQTKKLSPNTNLQEKQIQHNHLLTNDAYDIETTSLLSKFRKSSHSRNVTQLQKVKLTQPLCELLASDYVAKTYVAPPANFVKKNNSSRSGNTDCSTLRVNYNFVANISPERQAEFITAFEYAASIWQSQLSGNFPVIVNATFGPLGTGILGSAGANFIWRAGVGSPFYGEALAQEVFNQELSDATTPDIVSNFNTDFGWYLGTDGNAPPGTYDFVTVVLHELGHGLGFFGSGNAIDNPVLGVYGQAGSPYIYDTFVQDGAENEITGSFPVGVVSPALGAYLQSNNLFVNSPALSSPAKIYTPFPFRGGSSYSHFDEATYPQGTPNSLMTPFLGFQEANHDPGPNTIAMFNDHGWVPSEDCDAPISQNLGETCNITGISPDPSFPPYLCDNPGVFSAEGGVYGPVGSHVMCFRVEGIDPFNQPLNRNDYSVKIGGKDNSIIALGYDFFQDEQYFYICVGGIESKGKKNVPVKIKLAPGCTYTQGKFYDSPNCQENQQAKEVATRNGEFSSGNMMLVSPNPTKGELYIDLEMETAGNVVIQNSVGQKIIQKKSNGNEKVVLNLDGYPSGIYFASYISEGNILTRKFIKN